MRLAYLIPTPPSVSETFIVDEVAGLRQLGFDVNSLPLNPVVPGEKGGGFRRRDRLSLWLSLLRRRWYAIPPWLMAAKRFSGTPRWVIVRSLDVAARLARDQPSHLHVHFVDQTSVAGVLAGRLVGIPVTATAHARDIFVPPQSRFGLFCRYGLRFIAVCRYNSDHLIERGIPSSSIVVIPCGVAVAPADPQRRSPSSYGGALRILVVGRLVPKKGIDDLLTALSDPVVAAAVVEVRVVGDGPERRSLERLGYLAEGAGVTVRFLGALPREKHAEHHRWANLFCLPCKVAPDGDRDSMPVAIKEALVSHLPVVTTSAVGIPEMLDSSSAIMVPPCNSAALGQALLEYARLTDSDRSRLADAGHLRVVEKFALSDTVGALASFFRYGTVPTRWVNAVSERI